MKCLEHHKLLKFIKLNVKYNPDQVKDFYYNLNVSSNGLECNFRNQVVKFTLNDFMHHFGLETKGN